MKLIAVMALAVCAVANAQSLPTKVGSAPEKQTKEESAVDVKYCYYEDKKFTEGAVKLVDGQTMICMVRDFLMVYEDGHKVPRELVWELASSYRGKQHLKPAGTVK